MIPDELQDQAALYVLGKLETTENATFEEALRENAELLALVHEMREASADLAGTVAALKPPAELRQRVLREVALEKQGRTGSSRSASPPAAWLPWAVAALFMVFCGALAFDRSRLQRELADVRQSDSLGEMTFVNLISPEPGHEKAKVTVAWHPDKQAGMITIANMPPADAGHDYQLWAVCANREEPVNAGIIHVDPDGVTRVRFKPDQAVGQIKAFAISLEREGGVPKREGPIVMIGNA